MRISQLAAESGVSIPSIKYYLRSGLLRDGARTAATQAEYDEDHLARLRLIRAILGPGGASVAQAQRLIAALDDPPAGAHELLGVAHAAVAGAAQGDPAAREEVSSRLRRAGWDTTRVDPAVLDAVASALRGLADAGFEMTDDALAGYLSDAETTARREIEGVPTDSTEAAIRYVVLGTVLVEPLILALRRGAQEIASAERFGGRRFST